jgi:hypothetical protein
MYNLKALRETSENEFTFIIMDEIFNSANPVEGNCSSLCYSKENVRIIKLYINILQLIMFILLN